MTGFASLTREADGLRVRVTARSVNHRYLDVQVRVPSPFLALESAIREQVRGRVARGRVEVTVSTELADPPPVDVRVDERLIAALLSAAGRPDVAGATRAGWTAGELLAFPRVVTVTELPPEGEAEAVNRAVRDAVEETVAELDTMRQTEGEHLAADLGRRLAALAGLIERMAAAAAVGEAALRARLTERVAELAPEVATDPSAVAQEVVRFAARSDIAEELTRLGAHVAHWELLARGPEPCGRKLDFLLQEMNREVNTIGSKADGGDTPALVIDAKAELERLREQVQNVE